MVTYVILCAYLGYTIIYECMIMKRKDICLSLERGIHAIMNSLSRIKQWFRTYTIKN